MKGFTFGSIDCIVQVNVGKEMGSMVFRISGAIIFLFEYFHADGTFSFRSSWDKWLESMELRLAMPSLSIIFLLQNPNFQSWNF